MKRINYYFFFILIHCKCRVWEKFRTLFKYLYLKLKWQQNVRPIDDIKNVITWKKIINNYNWQKIQLLISLWYVSGLNIKL